MEQQSHKLVYLAGILGMILLIVLFAWFVVGRRQVVSPVPEEGIKVIFNSPVPETTATPEASSSATPKATAKPTPKPTVKPSPSVSPSPSAAPTETP